ncbi:GNAT family N-acetyltransferase [Isoptericola sp. b441]|uniref:GNAT family N-acetyltransferase n=1 Tax=Actinotalea lenta TaxID=3064654 RepID=A0ABT9DAK0_9CELL|nr:GNAT family N-acetyltransferase [Isoptericola sp. b441]MDO8107526.1 GNAT family N-acetyltransferase [Isoptericola sp. b441]
MTDPAAAELVAEYFAFRARGWPDATTRYRPTQPDAAAFAPPGGAFLLVRDEGGPAGCGGVRLLTPGRAEVKHLYLRERVRGRGWGRLLLAALEEHAAHLGAREVVLDTHASLGPAQGLYRSSGYREIAAYNDNPNATHWFGKALPADA